MSKSLSQTLRGTNYGTLPITAGGTGATSAAAALAALGAQATLSAASGSANGYLTSADWTTFNNKQTALGTASASVNGILSSADWTTFNGKQAALSNASASVSGILTSTDWSTFNGKQAALVSGTSIKTVNGTTLLGSGDLVITGGASATKTIANKTAAYTVIAGDLGTIINCTSGTFTVSLTAAATLGSGFTCTIWNTSNTAADAITIDPAGAETIDGLATLILRIGEGLNVVCDGTNWQIDNKKPMRLYAESTTNQIIRPVVTSNAVRSVAIGTSYVNNVDAIALMINDTGTSYGALGPQSFANGHRARTDSNSAISIGPNSKAMYPYSVALGYFSNANAWGAFAINGGVSNQRYKYSYSNQQGGNICQFSKFVLSADTTTTTTAILLSEPGTASTTNQLIVATGQAMTFFGILIAKQSASNNMASYKVSGAISNNAGTMALADVTVEKIVDTIGLTTEPTFTADSTNKALAVTSGAKATTNIRWVMNIDSVEVTYA